MGALWLAGGQFQPIRADGCRFQMPRSIRLELTFHKDLRHTVDVCKIHFGVIKRSVIHGVTIRETTNKDSTLTTKWDKLPMIILGPEIYESTLSHHGRLKQQRFLIFVGLGIISFPWVSERCEMVGLDCDSLVGMVGLQFKGTMMGFLRAPPNESTTFCCFAACLKATNGHSLQGAV